MNPSHLNVPDLVQNLPEKIDKIAEDENLFRRLFEQSTDAMMLLNNQGFLHCNQATIKLFGYTHKEQILSLHPSQISPELQADGSVSFEKANAMIETALMNGGHRFEWLHQRSNGENFPAEVSLTVLNYGNSPIIYAVVRDISDRKQAEIQLKEAQQFAKQIADNTPNILYILDLKLQRNVYANRAIRKFLGQCEEGEDATQTLVMDLFHPEDLPQIIQHHQQLGQIGDHQVLEIEYRIQNGQGEWRWLHSWDSVFKRDSTGQVWQIIGIAQDITERKQAEEALRQSEVLLRQKAYDLEETLQELQRTQSQLVQTEKMSSLGQLVAGIAHEINNPVNFIYGNLSHANYYIQDLLGLLTLYQSSHPTPLPHIQQEIEAIDLDFLVQDLPKLLRSMKIGSERIKQIVQSLRNFSRMDEAQMKAVNIHEGIDNTLMILQHRLKAKTEYPAIQVIKNYGNLPLVECYAGQLNQVFMNILSNAIDALDEREKQQTLAEIQQNPSQILIQTWIGSEQKLWIKIADNGLGMSEQVIKKIFNPFFTTKPVGRGTGLGLAISYQIITEVHGGAIQVTSIPNQGTEFMIEIPLHQG